MAGQSAMLALKARAANALLSSGRLGHEAACQENGCWPYQPIHRRS